MGMGRDPRESTVPGREVFDRSRNHQAESARRLVIEATCPP